jgi:actin-related protein
LQFKDFDNVRKIKEKFCKVSLDESDFKNESKYESYELPDKKIIKVSTTDMINVPEILFKPSLIGKKQGGIHKIIQSSIYGTDDEDLQKLFMNNLVISGGNTLFNGFVERLEKEISSLMNSDIKISDNKNRLFSPFVGASIIANQDNFFDLSISKNDYLEFGPDICDKKCQYFY